MKIAVIGGGISGISAALSIGRKADVTLYEKDVRLGGHANTIGVDVAGTMIPVDTGFMVFNPPRYPVFAALLSHLDVQTTPTSMSFSVSIPPLVEFASHGPRGLFADPRSLLNPRHYAFIYEIVRFDSIGRRALSEGLDPDITLQRFVETNGFSQRLRDWYLYPMLSSIWSCPPGAVHNFPALSTLRFLDNHQLLHPLASASWRTIVDGSTTYVKAAHARLQEHARIVCDAHITSVTRKDRSVEIRIGDVVEIFDRVIFATHADVTLSLLSDASEAEREILGSFSYSTNLAVLHGDPRLMPPRKHAWASWNFISADSADTSRSLTVTYNMNSLQHIDTSTPMFVTLNPHLMPQTDRSYAEITYLHPVFDVAALKAQRRLGEIQGSRNTAFAGAHWGYGFHEDGAHSGVEAARAFGFEPDWL